MLAEGEPGNNVGGVSCFGGAGNFLHGLIMHRGVVIRDHDHDARHQQSDERGEIEIGWRTHLARDFDPVRKQLMRGWPEQHRRDQRAHSHRAHQHTGRLTAAEIYEENATNRAQHRNSAEDEWINNCGGRVRHRQHAY